MKFKNLDIGTKIIFLKDIYFNRNPKPDIFKDTIGVIKEIYKTIYLIQFSSENGTWSYQVFKKDLGIEYDFYKE